MSASIADAVLGISILVVSVSLAYGTVWFDCWLDRRSEDESDD